MIFYSTQVNVVLVLVILLVILSTYIHFNRKRPQSAIFLLLITGFLLRLFMAAVDPFLQDWDERFHALVAKNLIHHPLTPMLRLDPIMAFKIEDWCCNHIWVHKQPLFLWQMALSMKLFGVNEVAMRLPSVIMGTISIYFVYDLANRWIKNIDISFVGALLFAVSNYQLELTSGRFPLEQNDVAFAFYVTASIWAFVRYLQSGRTFKWAIFIGIFVGCAVLNKWLTGILIYGGWGLYELLSIKGKIHFKPWKLFVVSVFTSLLVFVPWQLYIMHYFPAESSVMYKHNSKHIFEALDGNGGTIWFHFAEMSNLYGIHLLLFILLGANAILSDKQVDKKLSGSLIAMVLVIYSFFSFVVKTKMPAFTFPVNSIIWILIASGIITSFVRVSNEQKPYILILWIVLASTITLKPWEISDKRSHDNQPRNAKIHNTQIFKKLDVTGKLKNSVILNCKSFEDVELMFYKDVNAYHWFPDESTLDSLMKKGHTFAAFQSHHNQQLPDYIQHNPAIKIINEALE